MNACCAKETTNLQEAIDWQDNFFCPFEMMSKKIRPDQPDFSFCGPIRMVFFSNWNKNVTHTQTHTHTHTHTHTQKKNIKSLLEAKIWFMLSFRNNRRNIMCFSVQQRWVTKSTFSHMVTRVAYLRSPLFDWNESKSWTLFSSIKLF